MMEQREEVKNSSSLPNVLQKEWVELTDVIKTLPTTGYLLDQKSCGGHCYLSAIYDNANAWNFIKS